MADPLYHEEPSYAKEPNFAQWRSLPETATILAAPGMVYRYTKGLAPPAWLAARGDIDLKAILGPDADKELVVVRRDRTPSAARQREQANRRDVLIRLLFAGHLRAHLPEPDFLPVLAFPRDPPHDPLRYDGAYRLRTLVALKQAPERPCRRDEPPLAGLDGRFEAIASLARSNRAWRAKKHPRDPNVIRWLGGGISVRYCIYALFVHGAEAEGREYFGPCQVYVGQTRQEFAARMRQHISLHVTLCDTALHAVDLRKGVLAVVLDVAPNDNAALLDRLENLYVRMFKTFGLRGLNMKPGG